MQKITKWVAKLLIGYGLLFFCLASLNYGLSGKLDLKSDPIGRSIGFMVSGMALLKLTED